MRRRRSRAQSRRKAARANEVATQGTRRKGVKIQEPAPRSQKNDDYVAINAEIDRLAKRASEMEEEELETLFDIDAKRERLEGVEAAAKGR